jgi:hypothetical protein
MQTRCMLLAVAIMALLVDVRPAAADEQCRWEKCDVPLMPAGKTLREICACYRTTCGEKTPTLECACEEARSSPGRAFTDKGKDAGRMDIRISPDKLPAKDGQTATITVDVDLSEGRTDADASFRLEVSSGRISQQSFAINRRKGRSPPITYSTAKDAKPGDVMVRVFGGWVVILLGQATGTVYEGRACMLLN